MGNFPTPTQANLMDDGSVGTFANENQSYASGPIKTTASISGQQTYGATTYDVSDIMQGTFAVKDPSDQLLVLNKAATQDLVGLYGVGADSLSSYGSGKIHSALGGGDSPFEGDGTIKESYVVSLPKVAPNGKGFIWKSRGFSTIEMHLATSDNLQTDIAQHQQLQGIIPEHQHPLYMMRPDGKNAGENPDNANVAGTGGAWGLMDPVSEQYYMAMAWPFKGAPQADYRKAGRNDIADQSEAVTKADYWKTKILVYSVETKKGVVCTPGDWGPRPYHNDTDGTGNSWICGNTADTHTYLGTNHGAEVILGFMPDDTPVGPFMPPAGAASEGLPSTAGGGTDSIADIKYAGQKILNHPNCLMGQDRGWTGKTQNEVDLLRYVHNFQALMTKGVITSEPGALFREGDRAFLFPSLLNYLWVILEGGFILDMYLSSFRGLAEDSASEGENHLYGGAIDIGKIGLASEGTAYLWSADQKNWRRVADKLFTYLSTFSTTSRPSFIAGPYEYTYPNNYKLHKDVNPTHIHCGFLRSAAGTLMSVLRDPTSTGNSTTPPNVPAPSPTPAPTPPRPNPRGPTPV